MKHEYKSWHHTTPFTPESDQNTATVLITSYILGIKRITTRLCIKMKQLIHYIYMGEGLYTYIKKYILCKSKISVA